jgi:signal peptidase I
MNIHVPAQRTAPDQAAATAAPAPEAVELGWGRVLRVGTARAALGLVLSLVIWSLLPLLVGWTPRVILSGSMEPRIHVGDIVVTRTVPGASVTKGQVITVKDPDHPDRTRTHRMLRRASDGTIVTKGDANPQADSSHIENDDVLGLGVVRVPFVGRPAYWLAERNWLALGASTLFLGWCLVTVLPGSRKPEDTDDDQDRPSTGSRPSRPTRSSRPRRVAATAVAAAVVVGAGTGPASAAFTKKVANPSSSLSAAAHFYSYNAEVQGDSPYLYWRLDETSGTAIGDSSGNNRGGSLVSQTSALNQTGALTSESPNRAISFTVAGINANSAVTPSGAFSVEAWVKTTSTSGGRILGFGNATGQTTSTTVDRQLYLAPTGKVYFGIGSAKTTIPSTSAINNGAWHHVVGTYTSGPNGMKLYVDGVLQGQSSATPQSFSGYWRAGGEHLTGWAGNPNDDYFEGSLDELAVYTDVLTPAEISSHFDNATN